PSQLRMSSSAAVNGNPRTACHKSIRSPLSPFAAKSAQVPALPPRTLTLSECPADAPFVPLTDAARQEVLGDFLRTVGQTAFQLEDVAHSETPMRRYSTLQSVVSGRRCPRRMAPTYSAGSDLARASRRVRIVASMSPSQCRSRFVIWPPDFGPSTSLPRS